MAKKTQQIVDTNILLRYLVGDNKRQQLQAKKWFLEGQRGRRRLVIKPVVVAEACFVLESFYRQKRDKITEAFEVILSQKWLIVEERKILLKLLDWYRKGIHFVDSYLLAWAKVEKGKILSFDQKLTKRAE